MADLRWTVAGVSLAAQARLGGDVTRPYPALDPAQPAPEIAALRLAGGQNACLPAPVVTAPAATSWRRDRGLAFVTRLRAGQHNHSFRIGNDSAEIGNLLMMSSRQYEPMTPGRHQ